MKTRFTTTLLQVGNNTGIEVPANNMLELGPKKTPAISVDVSGYTYQSTVAVMGGKFMVPFSAAHRATSGIKGGDTIDVTLTLETKPRNVDIPEALAVALAGKQGARAKFDALAPSKRKEHVRQVTDTKNEETRARRIAKILTDL